MPFPYSTKCALPESSVAHQHLSQAMHGHVEMRVVSVRKFCPFINSTATAGRMAFHSHDAALLLQVVLPEPVVHIAAGGYASFVVTVSGKVYAWGSNGNGEQGSGQWAWSGYRPNLVNQLSDGRVKQVLHSCAGDGPEAAHTLFPQASCILNF
jgi:hypothetical protein